MMSRQHHNITEDSHIVTWIVITNRTCSMHACLLLDTVLFGINSSNSESISISASQALIISAFSHKVLTKFNDIYYQ